MMLKLSALFRSIAFNDMTKSAYVLTGLLLISSLVLAVPANAAQGIVWKGIKHPSLKDALFDSYQGRHFAAITRLQSEQKRGWIKEQKNISGLVLGGLYLAYGFHQEASHIFEKLLEKDQPPEVRNQAWFFLAKTQYQRRRFEQAYAALQRIQGDLAFQLQQERLLLHSVVAIALKKFDEAIRISKKINRTAKQRLYGLYNQGVAYYRKGEKEKGIEILESLGALQVKEDSEAAKIKDKANLLLGYGFLDLNDPNQAKTYFDRMQLKGLQANKALLGLGRIYSEQNSYKDSLVPWMELAKRDPSDPAVQDALMAVPFAFGQLEAHKQSLEHYEKAMQIFDKEIKNIEVAADSIGGGKLIEGILRAQSGERVSGRWTMGRVLDTPEGRYLWSLLASNEFRETLYNYSQMRLSVGKLEQWSAVLGTYENISDRRLGSYERRISFLQSKVLLYSEKLNHHLQRMALSELERRKQRLINYYNEARFSVAQIYDYAAKRWGKQNE